MKRNLEKYDPKVARNFVEDVRDICRTLGWELRVLIFDTDEHVGVHVNYDNVAKLEGDHNEL